jgi:hypothetical protein
MRIRSIFKLIFWLLLITIVVTPVVVLVVGLESTPLVASGGEPTPEDLRRAKAFVKENDPRRLADGERKSVSITERDINLAAGYMLSRLPAKWPSRSEVSLNESTAELKLTVQLAQGDEPVYANFTLRVSDVEQPFRIEGMQFGKLTIPGPVARPVGSVLHSLLGLFAPYQELTAAVQTVREIHFRPQEIELSFEWQPELAERIKKQGRDLLLSLPERQRLAMYSEHINQYAAQHAGERESLQGMLRSVFELANARRDADPDADHAGENRAVLLALGLYASRKDLTDILGDEVAEHTQMPRPRMTLTLAGRKDLARHFLISAAIAASANSTVADAFGLFKEVEDSEVGSGFSFSDLAADRAGVRLAEEATGKGPRRALEIQSRLASLTAESDFMPGVQALPDNLSAPAFQQQFQDRDSEAYKLLEAEIGRRIDACPVYF